MRRIKRARISLISLVERGANKMPVIYKSDDSVEFQTLVKEAEDFAESGELTAVVYAPEVRDSQGDIASADVIKDMAYHYIRDNGGIDIRHDNERLPVEKAFIAENFLIQKGDPRFEGLSDYDGNPVDVTGGWGVVVKLEDPELRKSYREGKFNGVSMFGTAEVEQEETSPSKKVAARMKAASAGEVHMTKEELAALLKENNETLVGSLVKGIGEVVAPLLKTEEKVEKKEEPETPAAPEAPVFKGDPTDTKALAAHAKALRVYKALQETDMTDPEAVEALAKSFDDGEETVEKTERKPSNQQKVETVEKTEEDKLFANGSAIAKLMNGEGE